MGTRWYGHRIFWSLIIGLAILPLLGAQQGPGSDLEGAWFRWLPRTGWINGQYRMELYVFKPTGADTGLMYRGQIYPEKQIRTRLQIGSYRILSRDSQGGLKLRFQRDTSALALVREKPEGFPVSTYLDIRGMEAETGDEILELKLPGEDRSILRLGAQDFRSYKAELKALSRQATPQAARDFLRLIFTHIYLAESRVKEFGTMAMVGMNQRLPGLIRGELWIEFQGRGFLGLGNSGVMFHIDGAQEFPGISLKGQVFGGVYEMEGTMAFYADEGGRLDYLGSLDTSQAKLQDGVVHEGAFLVELAGRRGTWNRIDFHQIAQ